MAEQEACTALVDEATKAEGPTTPSTPPATTGGQIEGESQLLPLLQGLLEAPENDVTPDSGTESGEDQRSSLIAEVQNALEKLSNSLKSDQTDISPERKSSLLQLVGKLQAGLSGTTGVDRRASTVSSGARFQKRKNRQTRHTVGVSKEELADARRLIEEISLNDLTLSESTNKVSELSKQNSESSVPTSSASSSYKNIPQAKVKNATAKPFSSSNSTSSSAHTPTEPFEALDLLFGEDRDVTYHEAAPVQQKPNPNFATTVKTQKSLDRTISEDSTASMKSACKAVQQAAANKVGGALSIDESESEEDESNTVKGANGLENAFNTNPIYSKPATNEERSNRFNTHIKKLKMKRANTIDIPKPLIYYEDEDDSESEQDDNQKRRDSYYALRGPIRVGNPNTKKIVPTFEPKTESDKKFLAFINKQNDGDANKSSPWAKNNTVWGNKFGNIKNAFEKAAPSDAKSFWKSADDSITSKANQFGPKISRQSARNLQQMFNEKQKETQKAPSIQRHQSNVVTGSLQVKMEPEKTYKVVSQPLPVNQFSHAPQSAFQPIPKKPASNRNSLVLSPEGGEIMKSEIKENNGSLFLYSPKPLSSSAESSAVTSPTISKPWAATAGGSRVLSLAASRFEQQAHQEPPKPRKMSKDSTVKVFNVQDLSKPVDKTVPYLAKSTDSGSSRVRKLSGQYDNLGNKQVEAKPQTYQIKANVTQKQYAPLPQNTQTQNYSTRYDQPQNYSIRYGEGQPQNYSIRYDQPSHQQYQPQNYSIRYDRPQNQQQQPQNYSIRNDNQPQSQKQYSQQKQPQSYSIRYDQPRIQPQQKSPPSQVVQAPRRHAEPSTPQETEYTSTFEFKPSQKVPVQPIEPVVQPPKLQTQISNESVHEYHAVSSKVMVGPVSYQATTVKQKSPMSRDQHDMDAALNLRNALQKVEPKSVTNSNSFKVKTTEQKENIAHKSPGNSFKYKTSEVQKADSFKYRSSEPSKPVTSTASFKFRSGAEENKNCGVVKPMQQQKPVSIYNNVSKPAAIYNNMSKPLEKLQVNERGQSIVTGQFHIPVISVKSPESPRPPTQAQVLSKSDSWHQICRATQNTNAKPAQKSTNVVKSKSSNTLALPKLFEAGMSKEEMLQKRRTMEAFLGGNTNPSNTAKAEAKMVKRSINRIKTSEKVSTSYKGFSGGLSRSRTLPDMICPDLLDESNIDKSFDELFKSS